MNGIGPITDTDSIKELERESAEDLRILFLRRQNSTKVTITATSSKAAAPPPMALASVPTGDVFCDMVNDVVDVFDDMVDVSGVVQLVLDGSDDALCTVGVPVIVVGVSVSIPTTAPVPMVTVFATTVVTADCVEAPNGTVSASVLATVVAIVPLLMPLMITGGERRKRTANALEHTGEL